jgi:hypothetical protein
MTKRTDKEISDTLLLNVFGYNTTVFNALVKDFQGASDMVIDEHLQASRGYYVYDCTNEAYAYTSMSASDVVAFCKAYLED